MEQDRLVHTCETGEENRKMIYDIEVDEQVEKELLVRSEEENGKIENLRIEDPTNRGS